MLKKYTKKLKKQLKNSTQRKKALIKSIARRPLMTFLVFLTILLILIVAGNLMRQPQESEEKTQVSPKTVDVFRIGTAPKVTVNAKIEKSGVITIVAQTSGVVQTVLCTEGEDFYKGNTLVRLSTNYQGGNAASIQRQIAQNSYENAQDTHDLQVSIINKQRDIANKTDENGDELREISEKSIDETKALISLNEQSIDLIDELIQTTEEASDPTTDAEKQQILAYKQQKSGLLNGLNAAKSALRNTEYGVNEDNPQAELADVSKQLTLQQLDLQEKMLNLNKETSLLQLRLAQVTEALMYPAAPFSGKIERVHVKVGQVVNPGDPIATISGSETTVTAVALVSKNIAESISNIETSTIQVGSQSYNLIPTYVATEPTNGNLFAVLYTLPESAATYATEDQIVSVHIPVGHADSISSVPFIPLDAIYQTQNQAYVFVRQDNTAQTKKITLGSIFGSFAEVQEGIGAEDEIILNRNIVSGDPVQVQPL